MRQGLAAAAMAVVMAVALPASAMACAKPSGAASLESGMIAWINQERQARGLNALKPSSQLKAAAQQHACDMAERKFFAHQRAGGPSPGDRAKQNGYRFRRVAENIAYSSKPTVGSAAELWRNSSGHWANILKTGVNDIGVALSVDDGRIYWVMKVGAKR
ncbi:MAG: CAP domain-containing protein [Cypionkella sp.]|jgi:uncharacterized protein YkwD|nr:CAP domain-containing protein [Cypionkella sp.]